MAKNLDLQNYVLETRICACGCKRKFRAWVFSKQLIFSAYECAAVRPDFGRLEYTSHALKRQRRKEREELQ
jgi:hypothetical protein